MNTVIIPEQRSSSDYFRNNSYQRILADGVIEQYSKEFYNPDFTRKSDDDDLENIKKEILLLLIENSLE
jgi:hypothetical protein